MLFKKLRLQLDNNLLKKIDNKIKPSDVITANKINSLSLNNYEKNKINKLILLNNLTNIMGLGKEKAKKLISLGLTNVNQLHQKKYYDLLSTDTKTWLKYKPEKDIPHSKLKKIVPLLIKSNKYYKTQVTGSFRRKKATSNDIDILVIGDDLTKYINDLKKTFNNNVFPYSKGPYKSSFIIKVSNKYIKVDAFLVSKDNLVPMLLYTTGSKVLNIVMRSKAKKLNMLLNQNGLFKINKNSKTKIKGLKTEKDYFEKLNMLYRDPENR